MSLKKSHYHCFGFTDPNQLPAQFSTWENSEVIILPKPKIEFEIELRQQAEEYTLVERQTIIHCINDPSPYFDPRIRIWPSTFLKPKGSSTVCKLLSALNISYYPEWTRLKPRKPHEFTLIFEGLPKDCTSFDLHEDIPEPGGFFSSNIQRNESDIYHLTL
ncbi:hypothetical protein ACFPIK_08885 [Algoriphagus aquatilis]|uniref:Uncharacterized protein n=1 Tax=Algoriphagus aquatilis TaxID=490186 RepID=A0ABW0BWB3_9BACT